MKKLIPLFTLVVAGAVLAGCAESKSKPAQQASAQHETKMPGKSTVKKKKKTAKKSANKPAAVTEEKAAKPEDKTTEKKDEKPPQ